MFFFVAILVGDIGSSFHFPSNIMFYFSICMPIFDHKIEVKKLKKKKLTIWNLTFKHSKYGNNISFTFNKVDAN